MRRLALTSPAASLSGATDVLAGFCLAAPSLPRLDDSRVVLPLLFASALLLRAAGAVFEVCFGVAAGRTDPARAARHTVAVSVHFADGRFSLKASFMGGALLALLGIFAALGAGVFVGKLPAYTAAFLFLILWAKTGHGVALPVLGPVSAGIVRMLGLLLGMSAHPEVVYPTNRAAMIAAALYFAYGALLEVLDHAEGEGGKRYSLIGSIFGVIAVFGAAAATLMRTPLSYIITIVGVTFIISRAWSATSTLLPAAVRRLAEGAAVSGGFLAAALCFGNEAWRTTGGILPIGSAALVLVLAMGMLSERYGRDMVEAARRTT
jgi:hypothetical protein